MTAREAFLRRSADEIRTRGKRVVGDIVEIGRLLTECKAQLGHGQWLPLLAREFGWSERTAQNFISVHGMLSGKSATVADLAIDAKALYALATRSMPNSVREQMLARAQQGDHVSHRDVAEAVRAIRSVSLGTEPPRMGYKLLGDEPATNAQPHPNDLRAARRRAEINNAWDREAPAAHFDRLKDPEPAVPEPSRMKDPVEQWLFDWEPNRLAERVIAADRISRGYAQNVVDAIIEKMGAPQRR
ncbi:DUF3102 domain-containing protein [Bradyrhizobium lablabi]|uniref:DUF3102 domain-containing protein n=1 Tax=Bradyrhizobium lablabi TaxID=722472 RepID=UPI001BAA4DF6|nr:DUF3102 domain-containing protein [Bradyrhizobium lablabi]